MNEKELIMLIHYKFIGNLKNRSISKYDFEVFVRKYTRKNGFPKYNNMPSAFSRVSIKGT